MRAIEHHELQALRSGELFHAVFIESNHRHSIAKAEFFHKRIAGVLRLLSYPRRGLEGSQSHTWRRLT